MDVARVYDDRRGDELRVLVDRLWPRGLAKDDPRYDRWCPEVAPSTELRQWYGHKPERFAEFGERYELELAEPDRAAALAELAELSEQQPVTLMTATKDPAHSHAAVLARLLDRGVEAMSPQVNQLMRWEGAGGTWQVASLRRDSVTVALCRCDGGEEVDRFTSTDPQVLDYVALRDH